MTASPSSWSGSVIALVTSILNSPDSAAAASALISFHGEVKDLKNSGILPSAGRDMVILIWAMLSPTNARMPHPTRSSAR